MFHGLAMSWMSLAAPWAKRFSTSCHDSAAAFRTAGGWIVVSNLHDAADGVGFGGVEGGVGGGGLFIGRVGHAFAVQVHGEDEAALVCSQLLRRRREAEGAAPTKQ